MQNPPSSDQEYHDNRPEEGAAPEALQHGVASPPADDPGKSAAAVVATGIFLSRIIGFVRERAVGHFLGVGPHADVMRAALRMPNLLQNLLGEGSISAAFIPIYSRMLEEGRPKDAGRFAGAIFGLLLILVSLIVAAGMLLAEPLVAVLAPGFLDDARAIAAGEITVDRYQLTVAAVRYTFPMAGILVLSAWALGVLNSHRKFFVPYVAPVLWSVAIIAGLVYGATFLVGDFIPDELGVLPDPVLDRIFFSAIIGALIGGVLQFGIQLPSVIRVIRGFRISFSTKVEGVQQAIRAFIPVVAGRGVYQISGYLDMFLATFLAAGALAAIGYAQVLYMLPISLFAMSVSASELPELSRLSQGSRSTFLSRTDHSIRRIAFMVIPSAMVFIIFGHLAVGLLFQTGRFGVEDTWLVHLVLAAYALGMTATAISRLLQNVFFALDDTKTPAKIAIIRVTVSATAGAVLMLWLDRFALGNFPVQSLLDSSLRLGAVGLALGAGLGAWIELWRLTITLKNRLPEFTLPGKRLLQITGLALITTVPPLLLFVLLANLQLPIWLLATIVLAAYGGCYLLLSARLGFTEGDVWLGRITRRLRR